MRPIPPLVAAAALATLGGGLPVWGATAVVTYLSGATVYLDAGERDGLAPGSRLAIEGSDAGTKLEAFEVTPRRAACRVVRGAADGVKVGERFRFDPVARNAPAATDEAAAPGKPWGGHGRVGVRYLATRDGENGDSDFHQPAIDARLDAPSLFGTGWRGSVDVRARKTFRSGRDVGRSRVYSLQGGWDGAGPGWRFGVGRQYAPDLANVSLFDGALAVYEAPRWSAGAFAGSQPDADFGFSSDVREYGAFGGWRAAPGKPNRWSLSGGVVGSYAHSEINREYLFVHGTWVGPRLGAFFTQELDFHRGWKRDLGEGGVEPTSTFASVRIGATDWLDVHTGFDSRRNVRLWRDALTPETDFDDAFRRGYWLGADARAGKHLRLGVNGRTSRGGAAGSADSFTASATVDRMTRADLSARLRTTRWTNDRLEGWLYAAGVDGSIGERFRAGVEAGRRSEDSLVNATTGDGVTWVGLTFDAVVARRLFGTVTLDRSSGDLEDVTQLYATLAYRF